MNLLSHLKLKTLSKLLSSNGEISPVSVLIVEDDGIQRQQWSLALHGMTDLEIEVAGSVNDALAKVKAADILLLDWRLGTQTGAAVLEAWLNYHAGNPCMVISGHMRPELKETLLLSGVTNVYEKVVNIGVILRTAHRYMRIVRAQREVKALKAERYQLRQRLLYSYVIIIVSIATIAAKEGATIIDLLKIFL